MPQTKPALVWDIHRYADDNDFVLAVLQVIEKLGDLVDRSERLSPATSLSRPTVFLYFIQHAARGEASYTAEYARRATELVETGHGHVRDSIMVVLMQRNTSEGLPSVLPDIEDELKDAQLSGLRVGTNQYTPLMLRFLVPPKQSGKELWMLGYNLGNLDVLRMVVRGEDPPYWMQSQKYADTAAQPRPGAQPRQGAQPRPDAQPRSPSDIDKYLACGAVIVIVVVVVAVVILRRRARQRVKG